jgi:hypothetical protein
MESIASPLGNRDLCADLFNVFEKEMNYGNVLRQFEFRLRDGTQLEYFHFYKWQYTDNVFELRALSAALFLEINLWPSFRLQSQNVH